MERIVYQDIIKWSKNKERKPLILNGARQVGKTWLMKEFGKTHFKYTAYVNFDNNKNMDAVFEDNYDIDRILMAVNIETGVKVLPEETLIIFEVKIDTDIDYLDQLGYDLIKEKTYKTNKHVFVKRRKK